METIDFNNICRTCVQETKDLFKIAEVVIVYKEDQVDQTQRAQLSEVLELFLQDEDFESAKICATCVEKATQIFYFNLQCAESTLKINKLKDNHLKQISTTSVKTEKREIGTEFFKIEPISVETETPTENGSMHCCQTCGKSFKSAKLLRVHQRTHVKNGGFFCDECGKELDSSTRLRLHKRRHLIVGKPFACKICKKDYKYLESLRNHERVHEEQKHLLCPTCGRSFVHRYTFTCHLQTHTKERPFQCSVCGKTFGRKTPLRQHEALHQRVGAVIKKGPKKGEKRVTRFIKPIKQNLEEV